MDGSQISLSRPVWLIRLESPRRRVFGQGVSNPSAVGAAQVPSLARAEGAMSFEERCEVVAEWIISVIGGRFRSRPCVRGRFFWTDCSMLCSDCRVVNTAAPCCPMVLTMRTDGLEDPSDLFASLRSGAVLCQLMNELMTDEIDFDPFPENEDGERANVELFITACEQLGLDPLFEPEDLLEMGNVRKVMDTLVALAQAAVDIGYEGPVLHLPEIMGAPVEAAKAPSPAPKKPDPAPAKAVATTKSNSGGLSGAKPPAKEPAKVMPHLWLFPLALTCFGPSLLPLPRAAAAPSNRLWHQGRWNPRWRPLPRSRPRSAIARRRRC